MHDALHVRERVPPPQFAQLLSVSISPGEHTPSPPHTPQAPHSHVASQVRECVPQLPQLSIST
jgi:hypothetical protein